MSHTPGPWADASMVFSAGLRCVVRLPNNRYIDVADPRDRATDDEDLANARLITAAPELLGALEGMVRLCKTVADGRPELEAAQAAIKKAQGDLS